MIHIGGVICIISSQLLYTLMRSPTRALMHADKVDIRLLKVLKARLTEGEAWLEGMRAYD